MKGQVKKIEYEVENLKMHKQFSDLNISKLEDELLKSRISKNTADLRIRQFEADLNIEIQKNKQLAADLHKLENPTKEENSSDLNSPITKPADRDESKD